MCLSQETISADHSVLCVLPKYFVLLLQMTSPLSLHFIPDGYAQEGIETAIPRRKAETEEF